MAKFAKRHFLIEETKVSEDKYLKEHSLESESIFSLGNEYMGARGFIDEGTAYQTLTGTYLNGIYEYSKDVLNTGYKGIQKRTHYMVNNINYFSLELYVNDQKVVMGETPFTNYYRSLELFTGKLIRKQIYHIGDIDLEYHIERFLDMENPHRAYQKMTFKSNKDIELKVSLNLSFDSKHFGNPSRFIVLNYSDNSIKASTESTNQIVEASQEIIVSKTYDKSSSFESKTLKNNVILNLKKDEEVSIIRMVVVNTFDKPDESFETLEELKEVKELGYDYAYDKNTKYFKDFYNKSDIEIVGDPLNQQGIRYCLFQLENTYHGAFKKDNIGAKGLTGEAYSGHTFWDTETYCLPYYLFNNKKAAKYLLYYRYNTLEEAKKRAIDLDCSGACYPIATLNGEEACTLWQHASLQFQPTTAVAYGIYHYVNVCKDYEFLYDYGAEMLVEISRFLATRGEWNNDKTGFGFYAVMGPDEFQMMINNNTYTNYMAKKSLEYTIEVLNNMPKDKYNKLVDKTNLKNEEIDYFKLISEKMIILYDQDTKLFEQHDGFYKLPHIDVDSIPDTDFPLYSHWSYDRIYRNDMIKQPDVLMFMLLYNSFFTKEEKLTNYDYYEPKCIHESSLSPSVHSILASELGKIDEALDFFKFATRMDLDDYNRNTKEGLHTTSISAAWLNIVYGFGGLRSDKELSISPILPKDWKSYSFNIIIDDSHIKVTVNKDNVVIKNYSNNTVNLKVYNKNISIINEVSICKN